MKKYETKYEKNENIRPDTLMKTLAAIGQIALVLIGLVGISVEFFRDNGILKQFLGKMFSTSTSMVVSLVLIIAVLYLINRWSSSAVDGNASKRGNLPMNLMMIIGVYFLFRLVTTGAF